MLWTPERVRALPPAERRRAEELLARSGSRRIVDDADLFAWVRAVLGVTLPAVACCSEHTAPAKAFADAYFARAPIAVWVGSRGFSGKSFALAALSLTEAATLGAEVRILGGSGEQSENVVRYMDGWTSRPTVATLLAGRERGREAAITRSRVRTAAGGMVDALTASTKAVRGPHGERLRCDEADEIDLRILDAALGQPMGKADVSAQTVISSTHQYARGTMTEVLARAEDGGWPVYQFCYRCTERTSANPTGWLTTEAIEEKRSYIPPSMWRVEYDLQQPVPPGGRMLDRSWFRIVDQEPAGLPLVGRSWDEGATEGGGDPTCGAKVGLLDGVWYICDMVRGQWSPANVDAVIDQTAAADGPGVPIIMQQEPGASGKARVEAHRRRLAGYDVRSKPPTGDKGVRARPLASAAEVGNVRLVKGAWNRAFLDEVEQFTGDSGNNEQDDQVDAVSWGMLMLAFPDKATRTPYPEGIDPLDLMRGVKAR